MSLKKGTSYDSIMTVIDEKILGTDHRLFVDNFYSFLRKRSVLVADLFRLNFPKSRVLPRGIRGSVTRSCCLSGGWTPNRYLCVPPYTRPTKETLLRKG